MTKREPVTAAVLIIGDEILSGRTQDTNLNAIARYLATFGIDLAEARVVGDVKAEIIAALDALREAYDYVITTGGIGPTHDDITSQCIAEAFAVKLILHPEAKRLLEGHYPAGAVNDARMRMAYVPDGAQLLPNPISRAPGFQIGNVYVMAGVPQIMQATFTELRHRLKGGAKMLSRSVSCSLGEGVLAKGLSELQARYDDLEVGSYPYFRRADFGVTLVIRGTDRGRLIAATEELTALILGLGGDPHEGASED